MVIAFAAAFLNIICNTILFYSILIRNIHEYECELLVYTMYTVYKFEVISKIKKVIPKY